MKHTNIKKRILTISLLAAVALEAVAVPGISVFASETESSASASVSGDTDVISYADNVTSEMCNAGYWSKLTLGNSETILMSKSRIAEWNNETAAIEGNNLTNIDDENVYPAQYNAADVKDSLSKFEFSQEYIQDDTLYINGKEIKWSDYQKAYLNALDTTAYTSTSQKTEYVVGVKRADILCLPTSDFIGYTSDDEDNENNVSSIDVNEPAVVRQRVTFNGHQYYYIYTNNVSGWVDSDNVAVCADRNEWLDAWKVDTTGKNFLVVDQDKLTLEASYDENSASELKLTMGTVLKLVPDEDKPDHIGDRGIYNNYVVYIPTRDEDGNYVRKMGLISQHYNVSVGFLDYTQKNVLNVAFSALGNRRGWGDMLGSYDCSSYIKAVYKCFGFKMPRNTSWQMMTPSTGIVSVENMSSTDKNKLLSTCPAGTLAYWLQHSFIYTGNVNSTVYVLASTYKMLNNSGLNQIQNNIILTSTGTKTSSGKTWSDQITTIVLPAGKISLSDCKVSIVENKNGSHTAKVTYNGKALYEGINYTVSYKTDSKSGTVTASLKGINNFTGKKTASGSIHNWNSGKITVKPTYTKTGVKTYTCKACGKTKTATVKKLTKKTQTVTVSKTKYTKQLFDKAFTLKVKTNGDGTLKYSSSNKKVVTVNSKGKVTIQGSGTAKVKVYATEGKTFKKSSVKTITIKVNKLSIS